MTFKTVIFIFFLSLLCRNASAQLVHDSTHIWRQARQPLFFNSKPAAPDRPVSGNYKNTICIKTNAPKLPFFCGMEDKFRSRFNVFLKLRAGNDEMYMNMIKSTNP